MALTRLENYVPRKTKRPGATPVIMNLVNEVPVDDQYYGIREYSSEASVQAARTKVRGEYNFVGIEVHYDEHPEKDDRYILIIKKDSNTFRPMTEDEIDARETKKEERRAKRAEKAAENGATETDDDDDDDEDYDDLDDDSDDNDDDDDDE